MTSSKPNVATTSPSQSPPLERTLVETSNAGNENIRLAISVPLIAPLTWATQ
jgi:hypothetical protein